MKIRAYDMTTDALVWRQVTREQLVGEVALQAMANLYGRIVWTCPRPMQPAPSTHIRRAMQDGLTEAEVWEVQRLWGLTHHADGLRADDDRVLNNAEDADDAAAASRFLVTPEKVEIEAAMEAVARDLPWMKEAA